MAEKSNIGWTDATWNVITGCKIKSPACRICYAMDLAGTRLKKHPSRIGLTKVVSGRHVWTGEVRFNEGWLRQPLQWSRPREIFVVAHGDLFYEEVPDPWLYKIFAVMNCATHHTYQLLTKRSGRMRAFTNDPNTPEHIAAARRELGLGGGPIREWPLPNVHGGVSAERQLEADERIPDLLASLFAKRTVSAEPTLGRIDFEGRFWLKESPRSKGYLDQIITGGESGRGKRKPVPTHVDIFRDIRDQCARSSTAFFHKQNGSWLHESQCVAAGITLLGHDTERHQWPDGTMSYRVGLGAAGALLDGVAHEGRPS